MSQHTTNELNPPAFVPTAPSSIRETGLGLGFLTDLVIKILYFEGSLSGYEMAELMNLPYPGVVDVVVDSLKKDLFCRVDGSSGFS